jgi:hypothetical protein
VSHGKILSNFIGERTEFDQVEKVKIGCFGMLISFQTAFGHAAYGTTGTVLENDLSFCPG